MSTEHLDLRAVSGAYVPHSGVVISPKSSGLLIFLMSELVFYCEISETMTEAGHTDCGES